MKNYDYKYNENNWQLTIYNLQFPESSFPRTQGLNSDALTSIF